MAEEYPVVIDNGSYLYKAGFGGEDAPRVVEPPLIAINTYSKTIIGDKALAEQSNRKSNYNVKSPFNKHGHIINWNDMVCTPCK